MRETWAVDKNCCLMCLRCHLFLDLYTLWRDMKEQYKQHNSRIAKQSFLLLL